MLRNLYLSALVLLCVQAAQAQTTCDVVFDLFGQDTACVGGVGFYLPPVEPFGGVYSGTNVSANGFFDLTGLAAGVYELTYTADTAVCIGSASVQITLVEPTPFTLSGNFEVCEGDVALISSVEGYLLTWDDGSKEITHTFYNDSTYSSTVTYVNEAGCASSQDFTISMTAFDRVEILAPEHICYGQETYIEVTNASYVQWIPSGDESFSISGFFTQDTTLNVKVMLGICDSIYHFEVQVADPVLFEIITDTTICSGQLGLAVGVGNATSYRLDGFGEFTDSLEFSLPDDQLLYFTAIGEFECAGDTSIYYIVDDYPLLAVTAPDSLCEGSNIDIYATGANSYTWRDNASGDIIMDGFTPEMQFTAEQSLDWSITGSSYYGCEVVTQVPVYVDPTPHVQIDTLTAFCLDKPIQLQGAGASTYSWSNGYQGEVLEFVGTVDTTFSVIGYTSLGCFNFDTLSMVMHEVPVVSAIGENVICEGDTAMVSGIGALTYVWEGILEGTTVDLTPVADSTVNFVGYTVFGCSDFSNFNIHVNPAPIVQFDGPAFICEGDSSSLEVSTNGTFQWSGGSTASVIAVKPFADTTYVIYAIGENGCPRTATFDVAVYPYPVLNISGTNELCYGDTSALAATGADAYFWSNGLTGETIAFVPAGSTTLLVYGSSSEGCTTTVPFPMVIHPRPTVAFAFSADTLCESGTGVSWIANPQGGTLSGDGVVNNWFDLGTALNGINTVTYTVVNEFNCAASASDEILVESCLGLETTAGAGLECYPNPVSNVLTIQLHGENAGYRLMNVQGACVLSGMLFGKTQIDMQQLASGTYVLEVLGSSVQQRERIVKL